MGLCDHVGALMFYTHIIIKVNKEILQLISSQRLYIEYIRISIIIMIPFLYF